MGNIFAGEYPGGYFLSEIYHQNEQHRLNECLNGNKLRRNHNSLREPQIKKQETVKRNDQENVPNHSFDQENPLKQPDLLENRQQNSDVLTCQGAASIPCLLESPKPGKPLYQEQDGRQIFEVTDQDICQLFITEIQRKLLETWHKRWEKKDWKEFKPLLKFIYEILNSNDLNSWNKMDDLLACFSQEIRGFESKKKSLEDLRKNFNWKSNLDEAEVSSGNFSNENYIIIFLEEEGDEEEKLNFENKNGRFWKASSRSRRNFNHFNPSFNPDYFMDDDFGVVRRNGILFFASQIE